MANKGNEEKVLDRVRKEIQRGVEQVQCALFREEVGGRHKGVGIKLLDNTEQDRILGQRDNKKVIFFKYVINIR